MAATRRRETALALGRLELVPDLSGALYLPGEATLLVADLHLEKGSSLAIRRGMMLPPYDSAATLSALAETCRRYAPRRIIALGDSFHDRTASQRLSPGDLSALSGLITGREMIWITGNHDPDAPVGLGGEVLAEMELAGVMLRHEPSASTMLPEIAGHLHPAAKVRGRGRALRRRCFALSANRLVMPAMGAYAGGLNLRDRAFAPLFPQGGTAHMIGDGRIFAIDWQMLLPD
jgi:uncharacterized protein